MAKKLNHHNSDLISKSDYLNGSPFGRHILEILEKEGYINGVVLGKKKKFYSKSQIKSGITQKMLDYQRNTITGDLKEEDR